MFKSSLLRLQKFPSSTSDPYLYVTVPKRNRKGGGEVVSHPAFTAAPFDGREITAVDWSSDFQSFLTCEDHCYRIWSLNTKDVTSETVIEDKIDRVKDFQRSLEDSAVEHFNELIVSPPKSIPHRTPPESPVKHEDSDMENMNMSKRHAEVVSKRKLAFRSPLKPLISTTPKGNRKKFIF